MKINDRLLMFSIETKKPNLKGTCINISFFKNGVFIISESSSFASYDKLNIVGSFLIKKTEFYDSLFSFLCAMEEEFKDAPEYLFVPGDNNHYYLSFENHCLGGSFLTTSDALLSKLNSKQRETARWNNKVIDFAKRWGIASSCEKFEGELLNDPQEAYLIHPQSLLLLRRARKNLGASYFASSLEEAIKAAARIAFQKKGVPAGSARFHMDQTLRTEALKILESSANKKGFDTSILSLARCVSSFDKKYNVSDILYWIDLLFLLLLFEETSLVDERKIALLHPPISVEELTDRYGKANLSSYKKALTNRRMGAESISPIYCYLEELVGENDKFDSRFDESRLS